jgi:hypothetical protein
MASAPVVAAAPHVSWLKKFGQDIEKAIGVAAKDIEPVEHVAAEVAEVALPQFSGLIGTVDGLFEKAVTAITTVEGVAVAIGQATNGQGKLEAVLNTIGVSLDTYVADNFPGSSAILKGEAYLASKTQFVNAIVAFLNSIDGGAVSTTPSTATLAAVAAAKFMIAAKV